MFRTDLQGDIICTSDGKNVTVAPSKNAEADTLNKSKIGENSTVSRQDSAALDTEGEYIGNKNSKKFHLPDCYTLPAEKNRVYFSSRQDAINDGYSPCGNCQP